MLNYRWQAAPLVLLVLGPWDQLFAVPRLVYADRVAVGWHAFAVVLIVILDEEVARLVRQHVTHLLPRQQLAPHAASHLLHLPDLLDVSADTVGWC